MFRFGSGKVATVYRHLADLSRRTLADDDDRLVADFASCYGFADPEWELPEYIAQRDELLASWKETYGFRTGSVNLIKSIPIWSLTSDLAHYFLKLVLSKLLTAVIQLQVSYIQLHARFARAELLLSCGHTHTTRLLLVL